MNEERLTNEYFEWLVNKTRTENQDLCQEYDLLLTHLYRTIYIPSKPADSNRSSDGLGLRWHYIWENNMREYEFDIEKILGGECSILELLISISEKCEGIMAEQDMVDRTSWWFWRMIDNLYLSAMTNDEYDPDYINERIDIFMTEDYDRDGKGGLFYVDDPYIDMRELEIWQQMLHFLNNFD